MQKAMIHVSIDSELHHTFRLMCIRRRTTMTKTIRSLIVKHIAENVEEKDCRDQAVDVIDSDEELVEHVFQKVLATRCPGFKGATIGAQLHAELVGSGIEKVALVKRRLEEYGVKILRDCNIAIAIRHHILAANTGQYNYHRILMRHPACVKTSYVGRIANKSRRCVIFGAEKLSEYFRENPR